MLRRGLERIAALVLAVVMLLPLSAPAFATEAEGGGAVAGSVADPQYACGKEGHRHGAECRIVDPLHGLLTGNGLSDHDGTVYVVHQHGDGCFASNGAYACPLEGPSYMDGYPNVVVVHEHVGSCKAGCKLAEMDYEIGTTAMPGASTAVPDSGHGSFDEAVSGGYYVEGMPGGVKDTGDTTTSADATVFEPHVHGPACAPGCDKPVVLVHNGENSGFFRVVCGKAEHVHGQDCLAQASKKDTISTSFSVSSVLKRLEKLNTVSDAQGTVQDTVNCQWFFDEDDIEKEWDDDVIWWHVEKTKRRYIEIGVRVNIGTNIATGAAGEDLEAGSVVVSLPYYLPAGRIVNGAQEKAVSWIGPIGDDVSGLSVSIDKENDKVLVTNRTSIEAGTHRSVVIFYKSDCWDVASGEDFSVDYSWTKNGNAAGSDMLKGRITTGFGIEKVEAPMPYYSPGDNYRTTYCAIAAAGQEYVYKWDYGNSSCGISGKFPRMTQEKFNEDTGGDYATDPDYIYDVMSVNIYPTGQQPYNIEGTFVPGKYPSESSFYTCSGWEGELVDAVIARYDGNSRLYSYYKPLDFVEREAVSYDDLPNTYAGDNEYANKYVDIAKQYRWNAYDFTIDASALPKGVSDLSDSGKTWGGIYCLSFLIRYPRKDLDNDGVISIEYGQNSGFELRGSLSLTHQGIDSGNSVNRFVDGRLYYGDIRERPTYTDGGYIYWTNAHIWSPIDKKWTSSYSDMGALNKFLDGDEVLSTTAYTTFGCYNERRPEVPFDTGKYYRLEGIIGIPTFNRNLSWSDSEDCYIMQNGDCRITQFAIMGMYDVHREFDIYTGKESYPDKSFPDWAKDEKICIYGSESSSGDDWELLKEYPLEEVWGRTGTIPYDDIPDGKTILRLKAVYPGSRLTTWFSVYYKTEYCPGGELNRRIEEYGKDRLDSWSVSIYQNSNYQAYVSEEYDRLYPSEDLVQEIDEDDWTLHRSLFFSPVYEVFEHGRSGMTVEQVLYDGAGAAVATYNSADYSKKDTTATSISKVRYMIGTHVYDNYKKEAGDYRDAHTRCVDDKIDSPYASNFGKFYILLPEGMEYKEGSLCVGRLMRFKSVDNKLKFLSSYYIGNRQLLVVEFSAGVVIRPQGSSYLYNGYGSSITFDVVPRDGSILQSGNYGTEIMFQFLENDSDDAVSLEKWSGPIHDSASSGYGGWEGPTIDQYIQNVGTKNLLMTSAVFRNRNGSEGSYAMVNVKAGGVADTDSGYGQSTLIDPATEDKGGHYTYSLTYTVDSGNSRDVVLWDSIEQYDRDGVVPDWAGAPVGVDVKDTGAVAYVNPEQISIDDYVNSGADCTWLTDGAHGWTEAGADTDWSQVGSVAFWFKDKTFDSKEATGVKSATVYLEMVTPSASQFDQFPAGETYLTHNEIGFTDWHSSTQSVATVLSNKVDVGVYREKSALVGNEMPRTGGAGTEAYVIAGMVLIVMAGAGATWYVVRKRKDGGDGERDA